VKEQQYNDSYNCLWKEKELVLGGGWLLRTADCSACQVYRVRGRCCPSEL